MKTATPFQIGDRVRPNRLNGWTYTGLSGKPDIDPSAVRRYTNGWWLLEVRAYQNQTRLASVVSIRTPDEDKQWWSDKRKLRDS